MSGSPRGYLPPAESVADLTRAPVMVPEVAKEPNPNTVFIRNYAKAALEIVKVPALFTTVICSGASAIVELSFFLAEWTGSPPVSPWVKLGFGIGSIPIVLFGLWTLHMTILDNMDKTKRRYY